MAYPILNVVISEFLKWFSAVTKCHFDTVTLLNVKLGVCENQMASKLYKFLIRLIKIICLKIH